MPAKKSSSSPKRDEIIEIASRLFYRQGFGATGIKQIIDEAGIAKGTFYSHFESKEELGLGWLRSRHETWTGWFEEALGKGETAEEKLLAAFDFLEQWLVEDAGYRGCAFLNTMAETPDFEHPMRAEVASHKRDLHQRFQELSIGHFQKDGIPEERARQQGTTFFLLFEGALVEAQNFHESWPIHAARNEAERILNSSPAITS